MRRNRPLVSRLISTVLIAVPVLLAADSSSAQSIVQYRGKLRIGFGNGVPNGDLSNNGIPACAATNVFAPQTFATLPVTGRANQTAMGALTFSAHGRFKGPGGPGSGRGGAAVKFAATCNVEIPGFLDPRLRSRIQSAEEIFPGIKGPYIGTNMTPTPVATATWMVGPGQGHSFAGATAMIPMPFLTGRGAVNLAKGPLNYGGAIQYQGGGGVQIGVNTRTLTPNGLRPLAPGDYGLVRYANGFLPTKPTIFGTEATGNKGPGPTTAFPNGVIVGQLATFAARTPGGTTRNQQGFVRTVGGGNTGMGGVGLQLRTPIRFLGAFFQWTTGMVQHTDMVGDFVTNRVATGGLNLAPTAMQIQDLPQATRKLSLVTPFSATIKKVGGLPIPFAQLGFGGVAKLDLAIAPVPEPSAIAMLGVGVAGVGVLARMRRRR